ncbi:hypothetical protein [Phenylobacterium sp.]|nr:hypothetical protein [Phenylobacterium sp.]
MSEAARLAKVTPSPPKPLASHRASKPRPRPMAGSPSGERPTVAA